ncbi:MAG: DUF5711 family protein, partial [Clostridia bacterium]|nr:DUF5711 family protein [Clostridia bacterium]
LITVSYDGINFISVSGEKSEGIVNHMSNPHINIAGNMILMYDKNNNNLAVYEGTKQKYSYECDRPIKNAKINKNGYVVLISDEIAYNSRVTVLNNKGEVAYIWKIGDQYIVDIDISNDNRKLVAATISTETGVIVENIVFVDINKAKETGHIQNQGDMPISVEFADSGNAIVMSDNKLSAYNDKAERKWSNSFENTLPESFVIDSAGNTVVALKGIKNNTVIKTYTKNGSVSGEYTTETQVLYMDVNQKHIALCEGTKVSVINYSGKLVSSSEIKKEVSDIAVIGNDKVVLLCEDCIQLLEI